MSLCYHMKRFQWRRIILRIFKAVSKTCVFLLAWVSKQFLSRLKYWINGYGKVSFYIIEMGQSAYEGAQNFFQQLKFSWTI